MFYLKQAHLRNLIQRTKSIYTAATALSVDSSVEISRVVSESNRHNLPICAFPYCTSSKVGQKHLRPTISVKCLPKSGE
jgi:hypothetical protein